MNETVRLQVFNRRLRGGDAGSGERMTDKALRVWRGLVLARQFHMGDVPWKPLYSKTERTLSERSKHPIL